MLLPPLADVHATPILYSKLSMHSCSKAVMASGGQEVVSLGVSSLAARALVESYRPQARDCDGGKSTQ